MMRPTVCLLLLSGACFLSTEPDLGGMPTHSVRIVGDFAFMGHHELRADTLRVFVTVQNPGSPPARMEFGVCSFAVRGSVPTAARGITVSHPPSVASTSASSSTSVRVRATNGSCIRPLWRCCVARSPHFALNGTGLGGRWQNLIRADHLRRETGLSRVGLAA